MGERGSEGIQKGVDKRVMAEGERDDVVKQGGWKDDKGKGKEWQKEMNGGKDGGEKLGEWG